MLEQKRRQYTAEFKRDAVELVTKQNYTVAQAASSLGISRNILDRWRGNTGPGSRTLSLARAIRRLSKRN